MRKKVFVVLLLVVVLITSVGCNHESNPKAYQLDYYMDPKSMVICTQNYKNT